MYSNDIIVVTIMKEVDYSSEVSKVFLATLLTSEGLTGHKHKKLNLEKCGEWIIAIVNKRLPVFIVEYWCSV